MLGTLRHGWALIYLIFDSGRADDSHLIANTRSTLAIGLLAMALAGCSSTVTMDEPTIPAPRVEKIPVDVALRLPTEFDHFVHTEEILGKEAWTIDLGRSNSAFFTQLFGYLFDSVQLLGPDDDARDFTFDALIEPSIDGFEFSVPTQSKTETFAVWIRYRIQVFDRDGNSASNWTVSAYGKTQKEGLVGSDSLQRAAVLAMRDAAALIIMQMDKATQISSLADGPIAPPEPTVASLTQDVDSGELEAEDMKGIFVIGGIDDDDE